MAKLTAAQIAAVFGMQPAAAVAYLEQKGLRITGDWHQMLNEAHVEAFTVANAAKLDVLQDLHEGIQDALKNGSTERQFIKNLTPTLQAKGWWGKEEQSDGNGDSKTVQLGSPRRLQTIYRTNMQSSYMAGRYHQMVQGAASHPYWQYIAVMDSKTRPSHGSMNGRVFRWDDPVWQFAYPPNGYNCRCRVVALSQADVDSRGLTVENSAGRIVRKEVQIGKNADGNPIFTDVSGIRLPTTGDKFVTLYTDAGFDVNQGQAATEHAARIFANKVERASPALGASAMTAARDWLMPQLAADYRAWANQVITSMRKTNSYQIVGAVTPNVLQKLTEMEMSLQTAAITLRDRELIHLVRDAKSLDGKTIPFEDALRIPEILANPLAVLWDKEKGNLTYVFNGQNDMGKIAVNINYDLKLLEQKGRLTSNSIRTAGWAQRDDFNNPARYVLLEGSLEL